MEELINIIRERKKSSPDKSYTNKLLNDRGMCIDKVNEEINELFEAIKEKKYSNIEGVIVGKAIYDGNIDIRELRRII